MAYFSDKVAYSSARVTLTATRRPFVFVGNVPGPQFQFLLGRDPRNTRSRNLASV